MDSPAVSQPKSPTTSLKAAIESKTFEWSVTGLIILNAIIMGMQTNSTIDQAMGPALHALDRTLLILFTIELFFRLAVYRLKFFTDPWSIFDTAIIGIAWLPATGGLSVLRALRILRVVRLISVVPSLRAVISGLISALPGMGSIVMLLGLVFYVFSVMGTTLFGDAFPVWFGSLSKTAYSLFQIMTLESWSMGIVRPVMELFPYAWIFFILFILCTTFTVLNLFIGVIVSGMTAEGEAAAGAERDQLKQDQEEILRQIKLLRDDLAAQNK